LSEIEATTLMSCGKNKGNSKEMGESLSYKIGIETNVTTITGCADGRAEWKKTLGN